MYFENLLQYWKKKKFLFISRDLSNLKRYGYGTINLQKYLELPLGISYSWFWHSYLMLGLNNSEYKWLRITTNGSCSLSHETFNKIFKTKNIYILEFVKNINITVYIYYILVRSKKFNLLEFNLYGLTCTLKDRVQINPSVTIFRESKKKWVWFNYESGDFIYFIHTYNKRMVFYQHIDGVVKKIGKKQFDLLKQTLPVKQKKKNVFENIEGSKVG